ncbi:MAG: sulfurtransferase TusA family protein [Tannerella sp.]|jgi:sulfite reductase (ferredoxin)|nr:sulfurtransferase TusA family protein [Tannerella sp.]
MTYKLPSTLGEDIARFETMAADYESHRIEAVQFKAFRVPMGVYEQRVDGVYMARVRTTGGVIYPEQLAELIRIGQRHHSSLLHITTRQEIQIQNLAIDNVKPVLEDLQGIGLATKGGGGNTVRNIMVSEFSGIWGEEDFDTTPYAMALTTKFIAEPDSYLLPRKLKIAFSSDSTNIDYAAVNDIGFVASIRDGVRGFRVFVGGGGGTKPSTAWLLFDFIPAEELFVVAGAIKKYFSENGNRKNRNKARLRFVFYKLGEEETIRQIKEYYTEAKKTTTEQEDIVYENERPQYQYSSLSEFAENQEYKLWRKRYVIRQRQEGYFSILVPLLLGNISLEDANSLEGLDKLLKFISIFGKHTIRFTTSQNIRLRNIPEEALPELFTILKKFVPDIVTPVIINNITSCTGADTCRLGICLSKELAKAIRRELLRSDAEFDALADVRIQISGCPNSCGQQFWGDIGFSGKVLRNDRPYPGYQVYLGAKRDTAPCFAEGVGSISARDIPKFVRLLLEDYIAKSVDYKSITQYLNTDGKKLALKLLAEYENIPSFADDKNYYFDWGADEIFSVVGRGTPECSAGLFDMIEVDLGIINDSRAKLNEVKDISLRNRLLYDILYSSSRMLLVTRGVEPKTTEEIFNLFIEHFIDNKFVNPAFRKIVTTARDNERFDFSSSERAILELADAVIDLYNNMDDSLQFKVVKTFDASKPETTAEPAVSAVARKFKDLRGVACPMNFVQTKILLSPMQAGEELEILLDDGAPINNVPGSVRQEGHEILLQKREGEYWKVIIKKK